MSISERDLEQIARLARLELLPDEKKGLARDLDQILDYVKKIDKLDAGSMEDSGSLESPDGTPFRDDVIRPSLPVEEALGPSLDHDESFFRVPPVIEREEGA